LQHALISSTAAIAAVNALAFLLMGYLVTLPRSAQAWCSSCSISPPHSKPREQIEQRRGRFAAKQKMLAAARPQNLADVFTFDHSSPAPWPFGVQLEVFDKSQCTGLQAAY
jgi:hypothetical protein